MNKFYLLQYKTELQLLGRSLRESNCRGIYIPFSFFENEKTRDGIIETLAMINKNIILYNNYSSKLRPSLIPDEVIKRMDTQSDIQKEKMINDKKVKLELLKKLSNINEAEKFVKAEYKKYCQIKKDFSESIHYFPNPFDSLLAKRKPVDILNFEFPYVPFPPINNSLKELHNLFSVLKKVNENFYLVQKSNDDFKNSFYNIPIMRYDINNNTELFKIMKERMKIFKNIFMWLIDFNELYHTYEDIHKFCYFIDSLKNGKDKIIVKYIGIYSYQFLKALGLPFLGIIRLTGYPGKNVNIPFKATRTRRLVDPSSFNFFNETVLGNLLKQPAIQEQSFDCDCEVCKEFHVDTYERARNIYLRGDPRTVPEYGRYWGRAIKTLYKKLRKIQNENILKHGFFNVEQVLNLSFEDFKSEFSDTKTFKKWIEIYNAWGI